MNDSPATDIETAWTATAPAARSYPPLSGKKNADVVVIGGGLTGMLSAYLLAKEGLSVVLLQDGAIGGEATAKTTGFLSQSTDTPYADLRAMVGDDGAKNIWDAHGDAIALVRGIAREHGIECEWKDCSNYAFDAQDDGALRKETASAAELGMAMRMAKKDWAFAAGEVQETPDQAKMSALAFVRGLAPVAEKLGVTIHGNSAATALRRTGDSFTVDTEGGSVNATHAISATHVPFGDPLKLFFAKGTYTSYVFELKVPKGAFEEATYEDGENPYHYFRVDSLPGDAHHDRMVFGGEDHRSDVPVPEDKNFAALEEHLRELFPSLRYEIVRRWSGPILEPIDGRASIGRYDGVWYGTAYSGNGMTHAAIAAMVFRDGITGKTQASWADVFDPARIPELRSLLQKGADYAMEMIGGAGRNVFQ